MYMTNRINTNPNTNPNPNRNLDPINTNINLIPNPNNHYHNHTPRTENSLQQIQLSVTGDGKYHICKCSATVVVVV